MTIQQFLKKVLIEEVKSIQDNGGHYYLSFGIIAQGIELLGACLDDKSIDQQGLSQKRFEKCILDLFPTQYHPHAIDLYKKLRCGLLHTFIPNVGVELIESKDVAKIGGHLLKRKIRLGDSHESLIVVAENFYEDLSAATRKIIDEGKIHSSKTGIKIVHEEGLIPLTTTPTL